MSKRTQPTPTHASVKATGERASFWLPAPLLLELRHAALDAGIPPSSLVADALRLWLPRGSATELAAARAAYRGGA